jgi:hypothetical protein
MRHIYIGYDERERDAYDVCRYSLIARASEAVHTTPLKHRPLRHQGLFTRPWTIAEDGQFLDHRDGKPFSTEFAFTRFLVPELARRDGVNDWVMFVDCDFLFLDDIENLFKLTEGNDHLALMCVQHEHTPNVEHKMDRMLQVKYLRKNWSSLMLFNVKHFANGKLTPDEVNYRPGWWLHGLQWLSDEYIGELPEEWNWLSDWSSAFIEPKAVHYTSGGPWMEGFEACAKADLWTREFNRMKHPTPTTALKMVGK